MNGIPYGVTFGSPGTDPANPNSLVMGVMVVTTQDGSTIPLSYFTDHMSQAIYLPGFAVNDIGCNSYELNGYTACTYISSGKNEFGNDITNLILFSVYKDSGFMLTFIHNDDNGIENNIDTIERIIDSFRFIS